jgi:hypothetical protein
LRYYFPQPSRHALNSPGRIWWREIPFMQAEEFVLGNLLEARSLALLDALADSRADDLAQCFAVAQAEGIGLAGRLSDGGMALRRTPIGPQDNVPEQSRAVQFVTPSMASVFTSSNGCRYSVRAETQRRANKIRERANSVFCAKRDEIWRGALKLARRGAQSNFFMGFLCAGARGPLELLCRRP